MLKEEGKEGRTDAVGAVLGPAVLDLATGALEVEEPVSHIGSASGSARRRLTLFTNTSSLVASASCDVSSTESI